MRLFLKTISAFAIIIAVFLTGAGLSMAHHDSACPMNIASTTECPEQARHSFSAADGLCYEIVTKDILKTPSPAADHLPATQPFSGGEITPDDSLGVLSGRAIELLKITGAEVGRKQIGFWIALHEKKDDADLV